MNVKNSITDILGQLKNELTDIERLLLFYLYVNNNENSNSKKQINIITVTGFLYGHNKKNSSFYKSKALFLIKTLLDKRMIIRKNKTNFNTYFVNVLKLETISELSKEYNLN